jgi:hypothetical protein
MLAAAGSCSKVPERWNFGKMPKFLQISEFPVQEREPPRLKGAEIPHAGAAFWCTFGVACLRGPAMSDHEEGLQPCPSQTSMTGCNNVSITIQEFCGE